jgi:hypothetical protein
VRLRFVHCEDVVGLAILAQTGGRFSHVEAVMPDGTYLGAHADGGVQARPSDYDKGQWARQLMVDLPSTTEMDAKFEHYLRAVIDEPYAFSSIFGFVTHLDFATHHHVICSALQALALRGSEWFATPLSMPAHMISPRDLQLILSGRVGMPEEETP